MNCSIYKFLKLCIFVMAMFNCVSLNCNGLCDMKKMNCIFSLCKERYYDVVCLQETFWNNALVEKIKRDKVLWDGEIFYSNDEINRKGVAILISKRLKNIFSHIESDGGRFICIRGVINEQTVDLFNIYAPNNVNERCDFFLKFKEKISCDNLSLIAGDFNTTLSPIDRSGKTVHCNNKAVKTLKNIMEEKKIA